MGIITTNINIANENLGNKLIFREDIINTIEDLKTAKVDNEHSKRSRIINMFRAHNIDCERNMSAKEYMKLLERSDIPSISTLPDFCWGEMVALYKNYKHPKDYMERLVNNLVAPEYNVPNTSIRLKILKQFLGKLNYLEGTRYYDEELKKIVFEEYGGVVADIEEDIFDKHMSKGHVYKPHKLLEAILEVFFDSLYMDGEYDSQLSSLIKIYDADTSMKTANEILKFIYDRNHNNKEKGKENNEKKKGCYIINESNPELVKKIQEYLYIKMTEKKQEIKDIIKEFEDLKTNRAQQFIFIAEVFNSKKFNCHFLDESFCNFINVQTEMALSPDISEEEALGIIYKVCEENPRKYSKINNELISCFRRYKQEKNEKYKKLEDNCSEPVAALKLLRICNDLAEGKFRDKVSEMKQLLYIFAFAFNMTVFTGLNREAYDFGKDISRQLFEDFYCDNVVRYICNFQKDGGSEEPLGITIQYKNFVEIVYLYWLNKDTEEFSCYRKLMSANEMINDIVEEHKKAHNQKKTLKIRTGAKYKRAEKIVERKDKVTIVYRNFFDGNSENFDFFGENNLEIGELLRKDEKDFKEFLLEHYNVDIKNYKGKQSDKAFENENEQKSASFIFQNLLKRIKDSSLELDSDYGIQKFYPSYGLEFLVNDLVSSDNLPYSIEFEKLVDRINDIMVSIYDDTNVVTRTKMMIAFYNYYVQKNKNSNYTEVFNDFCADYCNELNELLNESSYQLFSNKNLLDAMLLYSAFVNLRVRF